MGWRRSLPKEVPTTLFFAWTKVAGAGAVCQLSNVAETPRPFVNFVMLFLCVYVIPLSPLDLGSSTMPQAGLSEMREALIIE